MKFSERYHSGGEGGRGLGEVSSPSPITDWGSSDVWLAVMADRQIAAHDMCWESEMGK